MVSATSFLSLKSFLGLCFVTGSPGKCIHSGLSPWIIDVWRGELVGLPAGFINLGVEGVVYFLDSRGDRGGVGRMLDRFVIGRELAVSGVLPCPRDAGGICDRLGDHMKLVL